MNANKRRCDNKNLRSSAVLQIYDRTRMAQIATCKNVRYMSEKGLKCPIYVRYLSSYFLPFFSPTCFKTFLFTKSRKSRYNVFSATSEVRALKADIFMLSLSLRPFQFVLVNIIKPQINTDERRFSGSVSAFICVHQRLF